MDSASSAPISPPATNARARWIRYALATIVAGYAWFVYQKCAPYAGGSDSSGYLNSARMLLAGEFTSPVPKIPQLDASQWDPYFQQPLGYIVDSKTWRMAPSYPIGLPMHYAIGAIFVGFEKTARVINVLNALAAGALLYAIGRRLGLRPGWALGGVAVLWVCPVWIYQTLQPMSDCVATTWCLAAIYCALRVGDRLSWAAGAGMAFGMAVLVRPTNALLILPLAIALGLHWRPWLIFGVAGIPAAAWLGYYNYRVFGEIFVLGYNHAGAAQHLFKRAFFAVNSWYFTHWTFRLLSPLIALGFLALPFLLWRQTRVGALLAAWVLGIVGFYSFYFHSGETWTYLRFLLPAYPAVILVALLSGQTVIERWRGGARRIGPVALLAFCLLWQVRENGRLHAADVRHQERHYWVGARCLQEHAPKDAIVLAMQMSGAVEFYTDLLMVRWDLIDRERFALLRRAAVDQQRAIYAALFDFEKPDITTSLGSHWREIAQAGRVTIWQWVEPRANP